MRSETLAKESNKMTEKLVNGFCMIITILIIMGFVDWLWLFGVENSRSYTWYAVMAHFGK